jgi:hypothetical protein
MTFTLLSTCSVSLTRSPGLSLLLEEQIDYWRSGSARTDLRGAAKLQMSELGLLTSYSHALLEVVAKTPTKSSARSIQQGNGPDRRSDQSK